MSRFEKIIEAVFDDARYEPINVLVWGPGDPGPDAPPEKAIAYKKRTEIREFAKQEFHRAEVYFSEDDDLNQLTGDVLGLLRQQAVQAAAAHLVIMLDVGRGVDLELDHFIPTYPWMRDRVYVLLPEQYAPPRGMVKEVFDYLKPEQVVGFSDTELRQCEVVTKKAFRILLTTAVASYLRRLKQPRT